MSLPRRFRVLAAVAACGLAASGARAYLKDVGAHLPPAYDSFVPPARGASYLDPVFGTSVKRVSNARLTPDAARGTATLSFITAEYSTMSPFNKDGSRLLLQHYGYFGLYDGQGGFVRNLPFEISANSEPRWSRQDLDVLYYVVGNSLKHYNVRTQAGGLVKTFAEYGVVHGKGESDICFDGDHFVLAGDDRYVFVYTLGSGAKGPVYDAGAPRLFDQLYITPDDNVLIGWYQSGTGRKRGVELFNKNMVFQRQVVTAIGHMDVTRDANGDEVMVWANAADPVPVCNNGIVKVRLSDRRQTCLLSLDWSLATHTSATDNSGWVFVETYAPGDPGPGSGVWAPYTNEILQVKLDGSEVRRLAHHRSRPYDSYYYTPRVSSNRAGTRVVFSSNYGMQRSGGYLNEYVDVYLMDVPAGGPSPSPSPSPLPTPSPSPSPSPRPSPGGTTRHEENSAQALYTGSWSINGSALHSGARAVLSAEAGARVSFAFGGTGVTCLAYRDEWSGVARIYVDGVLKGTVDAYAAPARAQAPLYTVGGLAAGRHTLVVEVTGQTGSGRAAWVWIDAFEVAGGAPRPSGGRVEQSDPGVGYTGAWGTNTSTLHSGGSAALSATKDARATLSFAGTGASWVGFRDQWAGTADVYVDGVLRTRVDTYAATAASRSPLYSISGLPRGPHTLAVVVTGLKRPQAQGAWVWVDAFDVTP